MQQGRFITFEGIDGAGKTTQIDALEAWLVSTGREVVRTREPGGTPLGEKIRAMLLNDDMDVTAETLLFFASRAEHIARVIVPALARGAWVLSDRFTDATYAYQVGGKGFDPAKVEALEALVQGSLQPFRTILFDIAPEEAARRLAKARAADRFERESCDFFTRVREAYLHRAERSPERFVILDAAQSPQAITEELLAKARQWI
ncbi:MAG: dTMP kinase [Duodenibacillus sp.]|nr:dTMP kinase [Duodenibacillus sp.]